MTMDHADKPGTTIDGKVQESALTESRAVLAATQAALVISREEERNARLRALHDSMTGLANRDLFDDRLSSAISLARRHDWILAVMFLDLDGFKQINDTHGHAIGDDVLKEVARRLSLRSRDEDTVCRNGGDEFLYLLVDPQGRENIERIAGMICTNITQPIAIGNLQLSVAASMGVAIYPLDGATGDELIRNADTAMYRAKKNGGGSVFCGDHEQSPAAV
jgi:diguanylate cyclase (GGDEF)-like protein